MAANKSKREDQAASMPGPRPGGAFAAVKPKNFKKAMAGLLRYIGEFRAGALVGVLLAAASSVLMLLGPAFSTDRITNAVAVPLMQDPRGTVDFELITRTGFLLIGLYLAAFALSAVT
jgi:ATP-binding cassette subfamily B protein